MAKNNGAHGITLSDGRAVTIDVEAMRETLRTRKDFKRIAQIKPSSDEYDDFLAQCSNLNREEIENLLVVDFKALDAAVGKAVSELLGPN